MGLASGTITTHAHAVRAYREHSLPYLAWATRGLVELALWTEYCSRSPVNDQLFLQDTIRDHVGLLAALGIAERAVPGGDNPAELDQLQALLIKVGSTLGMNDLSAKFTPVSKAARDMGVMDLYTRVNTVLSKFVHPTALVTNSPVPDELVDVFSNMFIQISDVSASAIFEMVKHEQKSIRCVKKA